jgi:hypothetical protein
MEHSDDADRFGLKVEDVGPNRFFKHCRVMKWNDTSNFLEEVWNGVAI